MAHWAENSQPLELRDFFFSELDEISFPESGSDVFLFVLPPDRDDEAAIRAGEAVGQLNRLVGSLNENAVIAFLCSPTDAIRLLTGIDTARFQLWVSVKTPNEETPLDSLPNRHVALLVFSRYSASLRHVKTRIAYTYCPACGKTTKDYGGKKHTYHEYGTLMSDVWRDIVCDAATDVTPVVERLRDVFGLSPHRFLNVADLRQCRELLITGKSSVASVQSFVSRGESAPRSVAGFQDSPGELINEDSLTALARIPDDSVDFCFADPPYNLDKKYDRWNDALESVEYFEWCDKWLREMHRVLKPGRTLAVLNIPQWTARHYQALADRMRFQNWIVWEGLSFPVRFIMPAHYGILCFSKGEPRPLPGLAETPRLKRDAEALAPLKEDYCIRANCIARRNRNGVTDRAAVTDVWHDIHRLKHNSRRVDHPCQLPPMLMARLYAAFTKPGETILDCFNGAGTSTLVAEQMERRFIGIELSPTYHALALSRHEDLRNGKDPFGKTDDVPKAKNSRVERLPKQKYKVSKKTLQLDVRRIARTLGRLPSRDEVERLSPFPLEYFDNYFASWGEVCAAARTTGMSELPKDFEKPTPQMSLFQDF